MENNAKPNILTFPYLILRLGALPVDNFLAQEEADIDKMPEEEYFRSKLLREKEGLWKYAFHPDLVNGLLFTSLSFLERLEHYYPKKELHNKKIRQTENTLASILARMMFKLSPNTSFTKLGVGAIGKREIPDFRNSQLIYLGYEHFELVKSTVLEDACLFEKLEVGLNKSIISAGKYLKFYIEKDGQDFIRELEKSEIIEWLLDWNGWSKNPPLIYLIEILQQETGVDRSGIDDFINQLLDVGFIQLITPYRQQNELKYWFNDNNTKACDTSDLEKAIDCINTLIRSNTAVEKRASLSSVFTTIEDSKSHKNYFSSTSIERSFHELCASDISFKLSGEKAKQWCEKLDRLAAFINSWFSDQFHEEIMRFAERTLKGKMPLLLFFESFLKDREQNEVDFATQSIEKQSVIIGRFRRFFKHNDGEVHVNFKDLEWGPNSTNYESYTLGSIIQPCFSQGEPSAFYLKNYSAGYGRLWGRYLRLFDSEIRDEIQKNAEALHPHHIVAFCSDSSNFMAEQYQYLPFHEVVLPGGDAKKGSFLQVPLKEIWVKFDPKLKAPVLVWEPKDKRLKVIDLGLEGLSTRSMLYRFITSIEMPPPGCNLLKKYLLEVSKQILDSRQKIYFYPRVTLDDTVIIQRKTWKLTGRAFPQKKANEDFPSFYKKINEWRKQFNIPSRVFVSLNSGSKRIKPQYFNFQHSILLRSLPSLARNTGGEIIIEEMLPDKDHLYSWQEKNWAMECGLQWEHIKDENISYPENSG